MLSSDSGSTPQRILCVENGTAIIDDFGEMTFKELDDAAHSVANGLLEKGVKGGDGVAILARNHRWFLVALYGAARTGVAAGNAVTGTAQPLEPLDTRDTGGLPVTLKKLLREWQPDRLIVGFPLSMDGEKTASTKAAEVFAEQLQELSGLPVELHDERLTTREANQRFREARQGGQARRKQSRRLDSMAAALILESWMAER